MEVVAVQGSEAPQLAAAFDEMLADVSHVLVQLLGQETRRLGITIPQAHLMRQLRRRKECTAATVGDVLGITSGPVTSITRRLEQHGLIRRRRDPVDRRVVWFSLTSEGDATLDRFIADSRKFWEVVFADLGDPAGISAIEGLRSFAESLGHARDLYERPPGDVPRTSEEAP